MKIENGQEYRPYKRFIGSIIPNSLMKYKGISDGAKICFARLCQYNGKNGSAFPSYETLANEMAVDRRTAQRRVDELVRNGLISIQYKTGRTNTYKFIWNSKIFEEADIKEEDTEEESTSDKSVMGSDKSVTDNEPTSDNIVMGGRQNCHGRVTNLSWGGDRSVTHKRIIKENNKENNIRDSSPDDSYSIINFDNFSRSNIVFSHILLALEHNIKKLSGKDISLSEEEYSIMYSYRYKIIDYPDVEKLVELLDSKISNLYCSREEFDMEEVLSSILN